MPYMSNYSPIPAAVLLMICSYSPASLLGSFVYVLVRKDLGTQHQYGRLVCVSPRDVQVPGMCEYQGCSIHWPVAVLSVPEPVAI